MEIRFHIPGVVPSVNHMYQDKWIRGRKYEVYTKEANIWFFNAQSFAIYAARKQQWQMIERGKKVVTEITFYFPDKRLRDNNNNFKIICDSFEGIIYENDYWCLPRVMDFLIDKQNPRVEIRCYLFDHMVNVQEKENEQ